MSRADLLALSDDSLAALANRGLVKRALREVAAGAGPELATSPEGEVTGTWPDGTVVALAPGRTLDLADCSCSAPGVCRHRVMLAIAVRSAQPPVPEPAQTREPVPPSATSPGAFTDEELEEHLSGRAMAAARKAQRAGYGARVRRPGADDPVATVELASVTVRFLVAGELGYAQADAARGARPDAVALAVWAWRVADEVAPGEAVVDVQVGTGDLSSPAQALTLTLDTLADVLHTGVAHLDDDVESALAVARRALDARNLRWPVDALDDVVQAVRDYRSRSSAYSATETARHVAELVARARCADGGASPRSAVLGTEEASRTPMRLARLTGLGARLSGSADRRLLEVYLAHPQSGTVLVLRRAFTADEDGVLPDLDRIRRSSAGGHRLSLLAAAEIVTESAVRAANRTVTLSSSRVAQTTVAPSAGRWAALPPSLLVDDLDDVAGQLAARPPRVVRPRVAAHDLRAVVVEEVLDLGWGAGSQELRAVVRARTGELLLRAPHTAAAPGAVDALHRTLSGELGPVRHVAGHLFREGGQLVLAPTAVVAGEQVVVPDLAPVTGELLPGGVPSESADPLRAAVTEALDTSAAVLDHGAAHLPPSWLGRVSRDAEHLERLCLTAAGAALRALPACLGRTPSARVLDAWADVHLCLLVTAEQL